MSEVNDRSERAQNLKTVLLYGAILLVAIGWGWTRYGLPTLLSTAKSIGVFVVALGILVFIHEFGHFLAARLVGVTVPEFAIGFGPKLFTYLRRRGTEYTVRLLPLGGFVNLKGMNPEEEETPDGLNGKPAWARGLVFFAGPLANLALAIVLLCSMGALFGGIRAHVFVEKVEPDSPAAHMGLQPEDQIISVQGRLVDNPRILIDSVAHSNGQTVRLEVLRAGAQLTLVGAPQPLPGEASGVTRPRLGILLDSRPYSTPRMSVGASIREGMETFGAMLSQLGRIFRSRRSIGENVGGPVAIARVLPASARAGILPFLTIMAGLSLSLAIFNLLPIPILDGGHLMLLTVEVLRRRRLDPATQQAAQLIGMTLIGIIFVLITYKDITRWVKDQRQPPARPPAVNAPAPPAGER